MNSATLLNICLAFCSSFTRMIHPSTTVQGDNEHLFIYTLSSRFIIPLGISRKMSLIAIIAGVMGPNCVSCYRCSLTNVKSLATVDNRPFFVSSLHAFLSFPLLIILLGIGLLVYRLSIYPIHPILSILSLFHLFPSSYLISYPSHLTQHRLPKHPSHVLL